MPPRSEPYRPASAIVAELAAGAVLLRDSGLETLLLHQRDEDRWCFPKGHVDPGESLADAATREIREETGFTDVRLGEEVAEVSYRFFRPKTQVNVHKTTVYFLAYTSETSPHPEKIFDRAEWFDLPTARERVKYPTDRVVIDAVLRMQSRSAR
ncbi:MAG: NUDIX domain-containing protein [Thermoplasmata archaeon]